MGNKENKEDKFDKYFTGGFLGVVVLIFLIGMTYYFFHPEKMQEMETQSQKNEEIRTELQMQKESTQLWEVVYMDEQGKIFRFLPNDTMFLDSRKKVYNAGYGTIIQLFDAEGTPLTYNKYLEQIEKMPNKALTE